MSRRFERVNELLRQELSQLLARDLNDPRIPLLVTVTRVETSADLRYAQVYVSVMGDSGEQHIAVDTLQSAAGFIQRGLRPKLKLRFVPVLSFKLDHSLEEGARMLRAIEDLPIAKEPG